MQKKKARYPRRRVEQLAPAEPVDRPPLFPHAPRRQDDYLESLISQKDFNPIKSHQFEGAIHLGFVVLTILIVKYAFLSLYTHGYLLLKSNTAVYCISYELLRMLICDCGEGLGALPTFLLYKLFLGKVIGKTALRAMHYVYISLFSAVSLWSQWDMPPLPALISVMLMGTYVLKMHSYVATNILLHDRVTEKYEDIVGPSPGKVPPQVPRFTNSALTQHPPQAEKDEGHRSVIDPDSVYPSNVNFKNYLYFIFCAPSLVYETKFSRSQNVRVLYVIRELCGFFFLCFGLISIITQFILPVMAVPGDESLMSVLGDIFSVCIPSLFVWLLAIYAYFHCWLNAKSELVRFSNRVFYKDWWNADSIGAFWRKWNLPVHEWCLRHLYLESMYYFHATKDVATVLVLLVMTVMHEIFFSCAFKAYHPFFLITVIAQIPLVFLNRKVKNSRRVGNVIMWISLMFGQPLLEILYFRTWIATQHRDAGSFWCRSAAAWLNPGCGAT
ncbi:MAG: MBOAT family O-acyltransferase [Candidatus Pacebacteria bacterium]|nr:MBOAT family O-acyltransferase [Candidatus Paceibacterota bacterium]